MAKKEMQSDTPPSQAAKSGDEFLIETTDGRSWTIPELSEAEAAGEVTEAETSDPFVQAQIRLRNLLVAEQWQDKKKREPKAKSWEFWTELFACMVARFLIEARRRGPIQPEPIEIVEAIQEGCIARCAEQLNIPEYVCRAIVWDAAIEYCTTIGDATQDDFRNLGPMMRLLETRFSRAVEAGKSDGDGDPADNVSFDRRLGIWQYPDNSNRLKGQTELPSVAELSNDELLAEVKRRAVSLAGNENAYTDAFNEIAAAAHAKTFGFDGPDIDTATINAWLEEQAGKVIDNDTKEKAVKAIRFFAERNGLTKLFIAADGREIPCSVNAYQANERAKSLCVKVRPSEGSGRTLQDNTRWPRIRLSEPN